MHDHGERPHDHRHHGNPDDLAAYVARLDDPERDAWQRPAEVVAALELDAGATVAEIGAGSGYFTLRLAAGVGPTGRVFAVDVEPRLLALLRDRLAAAALGHVTPVLGQPGDPLLPAGACDRVVAINTYHHLPDGAAYLRRLAAALAPGGRIAIIDFERRDTPMGPPLEDRVAREDVRAAAAAAGLRLRAEPALLEHQYVLVLEPA